MSLCKKKVKHKLVQNTRVQQGEESLSISELAAQINHPIALHCHTHGIKLEELK